MGSSGKLITSAEILDGTIATVDIAAKAVTQILVPSIITANPSTTATTSGSAPVLAECTTPITTTGGDVLVLFSGTFSHTGGSFNVIEVRLDGAVWASRTAYTAPGTTVVVPMITAIPAASIPTGAHTIAITYWSNIGATLTGQGGERTLVVMEVKR